MARTRRSDLNQSDKVIISQLEHTANEAFGLAKQVYFAQASYRPEIESLKLLLEDIRSGQERIEDRINKQDDRLASNLKWSVATLLSAVFTISGLIFTIIKFGVK